MDDVYELLENLRATQHSESVPPHIAHMCFVAADTIEKLAGDLAIVRKEYDETVTLLLRNEREMELLRKESAEAENYIIAKGT